MHQPRRRARRPAYRVPAQWGQAPLLDVGGADVVLVGYFSAKQKDFATIMALAAKELAARGARVVGQFMQRRGVSDGGVHKMTLPYSSRTLLTYGKVHEVAEACERAGAAAAIFVSSLTERQRRVLTTAFGCPAMSLSDILEAD